MPSKLKNLKVVKRKANNKVVPVAPPTKNESTLLSMPKQQQKSTCFVGEAATSSTTKKNHRTVDSYYDECQFKLYLVVFLALLNAFNCGHAASLALVLNPSRILDLHRYQPRQYVLAMALYFTVGNITGASLASEYNISSRFPQN